MDPRPPHPPIKKELTSEEKKVVESFNAIPFHSIRRKSDLILTWRKFKAATNLHLEGKVTQEGIDGVRRIIEKAGMYFKDSGVINGDDFRVCFVANNEEDLEKIAKLWFGDHINDPNVYLEIGRMSAFPKSAVEMFDEIHKHGADWKEVQDKLALTETEKKALFPKELYSFSILFLMSKANWQKELETVRKWVEEIKLVDPEYYEFMVTLP